MLDATGERAAAVIERTLSGGPISTTRAVALEIVNALQEGGLLARCSCPVGFGQVADRDCPAHGFRDPAHTIIGHRS